MITRGLEKGKSVWDSLNGRFRSEIAVSQMCPSMFESIYHVAADTFKLLQHESRVCAGHHFADVGPMPMDHAGCPTQSSELSCWGTWTGARQSVLYRRLELGQQVALMVVDLQSGRNLVLRAVVESSETKTEAAMPHQLFPTRVVPLGTRTRLAKS